MGVEVEGGMERARFISVRSRWVEVYPGGNGAREVSEVICFDGSAVCCVSEWEGKNFP